MELDYIVSSITFWDKRFMPTPRCPFVSSALYTHPMSDSIAVASIGHKFAFLDPIALLALKAASGTCRRKRVDQGS